MKMGFRAKAALIIAAVLFLQAIVTAQILRSSKIVRVYDEAGYITAGLEVREMIARGEHFELAIRLWHEPLPRKVFALIEGVVLVLLDRVGMNDIDSMILFSNLLCLFILLASVYKIGSMLHSPKAGLLAAVLLSFSPVIFAYARGNILELPLAAMVCLALLCLLKTDNLRSRFFSVLTALVFILAQFTKEIAIVFIGPLFLYYSFKSLSGRQERRRRAFNFAMIVLLFLLPTAAFYLRNSNGEMMRQLLGKAWLLKVNEFDFVYYLREFPLRYLGRVLFVAFVPLMLHYAVNIRKRDLFLTLWLFIPLLVFSLSPNRVSRFLIPSLPAVFLLLSFELFHSLFSVRKAYAAVLIAAALFQYAVFSLLPRFPLPRPEFEWGLLSARQDSDIYAVEKMVDIFSKERPSAQENRALFIFNLGWHCALAYELRIRNLPFFVECPQEADHADAPAPGTINWQRCLLTADYVVDKTGDLGERGAYEDVTGEFIKTLKENAERFEKIAEFEVHNGDTIYVYRRKAS